MTTGNTSDPQRLVVIGGSDAGISAALRAREVRPATQVRLIVADSFPNYSICGLPFYLSGDVQLFGAYGKEVSKRIDTIATALHHRMRVEELNELDLSYTPPLSSPWDPLQMAAQAWLAAAKKRDNCSSYPDAMGSVQ